MVGISACWLPCSRDMPLSRNSRLCVCPEVDRIRTGSRRLASTWSRCCRSCWRERRCAYLQWSHSRLWGSIRSILPSCGQSSMGSLQRLLDVKWVAYTIPQITWSIWIELLNFRLIRIICSITQHCGGNFSSSTWWSGMCEIFNPNSTLIRRSLKYLMMSRLVFPVVWYCHQYNDTHSLYDCFYTSNVTFSKRYGDRVEPWLAAMKGLVLGYSRKLSWELR